MRRVRLVLLALLALGAAGIATSATAADDDGTLSVQGAVGLVQVKASGAVVGRITTWGRLKITDPDPGDGSGLQISKCPDKQDLSANTLDPNDRAIVCTGADIRFRLVGGAFRLTINGSGVNLSVVGKGHVTLAGTVTPVGTGDGYTIGTYSVNDSVLTQMPEHKTFELDATTST
jgi:hypothetical protein